MYKYFILAKKWHYAEELLMKLVVQCKKAPNVLCVFAFLVTNVEDNLFVMFLGSWVL